MSTLFNGLTSEQRWAITAANQTGPFTFADIIKSENADNVWQSYLSNYDSGGAYRIGTGRRDGGDRYLSNPGGAALPDPGGATNTIISQALGWCMTVTTKEAGSSQPYFYRYQFSTDTLYQVIGAPGLGDPSSQAGGHIRFGKFDADLFGGKAAVHAEWTRALTPTEVASLVANRSTIDFNELDPAWLTDAADQFATDLTGNGGNRTTDTDTTSSADDPPDGAGGFWSYGLTPPAEAPISRAAPIVSYGTPTPHVGDDLTCSQGGWLKFPTGFAYQWLRDGEPISGATSSTYEMRPEDERHQVTCRVTATNAYGAAARESGTVQPRAALLPAAPSTVMVAIDGEWVPRPARYVLNGEWT